MFRQALITFLKTEDGFLGAIGGIVGGLSSIFGGNKTEKKSAAASRLGFDYLRNNPLVGEAQGFGSDALGRADTAAGLQSALLGLGGDQEAADRAFSTYRDSTGYDFRLGQGMDAIEGSRAARGILNSGATAKELNSFAQNMASEEYSRYLDQLSRREGADMSGAQLGLQSAYRCRS